MDPDRVKSRKGKSKEMRPPKKTVPSETKRIHLQREPAGEPVEKSRGRAVGYNERDAELLQSLRNLNEALGKIKSRLAARDSKGDREPHDTKLDGEMKRLTESMELLTTKMDYKPSEETQPKDAEPRAAGEPGRAPPRSSEPAVQPGDGRKAMSAKEAPEKAKRDHPAKGSVKKSLGAGAGVSSSERKTFGTLSSGASGEPLSRDFVKEDLFRKPSDKLGSRRTESRAKDAAASATVLAKKKASPLEERAKKEVLGVSKSLSFADALVSKAQEPPTDPQKHFSRLSQNKDPSLLREEVRPVRRERDSIRREAKPEIKKGRARQGGKGHFKEGVRSYKR